MSASPIWTVHCEATRRSDGCAWWTGEADTREQSERIARAQGWLVGRTRRDPNLCPACREGRS